MYRQVFYTCITEYKLVLSSFIMTYVTTDLNYLRMFSQIRTTTLIFIEFINHKYIKKFYF